MPLRGEHLAQLHAAILSAYSLSSLKLLSTAAFKHPLEQLVPLEGRNVTDIVYDLVRWAADNDAVGVQGLLQAAWEQNATNPQLTALHAQWTQIVFDLRPPCPYPGMQPFRSEESSYFFGREVEINDAVQRLRLHPFLIVIGASGSGKSSLVFAGIAPAMQKSSFFGGERLQICVFRPDAAPMSALAAALGCPAGAVSAPEELIACAREKARAAPTLLIVDQFEETFTLAPAAEAALFQSVLPRLIGLPGLSLLITARADFYANLMNSPLWPAIQAHRLEITTLGEEALRAAITLPAAAVGVTVQESLVERLVADAAGEPGALPFLQETLVLLWDKLRHAELPLAAYTQLAAGQSGRTGLQVAMALRADAALADPSLPTGREAIARRIFLRLVQFGEGRPNTRRQQAEGDLRAAGDDPAAFDAVLSLLIARRLLIAGGDSSEAGRRIDIAHEALIGGWPLLRGWVSERRQAEIGRRRLEDKAAEWVRLGRGDAGLLDRVEIKEAAAYLDGPDGADLGASPDLLALVGASRQAVDPGWNRRGVLALAGGALAVLALLAAGLFYLQTNLLVNAVRIALLLFWVALAAVLGILFWLLRRSDQHFLKRWSQNITRSRWGQSGVAAASIAACVAWLAIGAWALPIEQQCRQLNLSRPGDRDVIGVIGQGVGEFETQVFARMMQRVSNTRAQGWPVTQEVARTCATFFSHTVLLGLETASDGESAYFVDELDQGGNGITQIVNGYGATDGCQGLLYVAFEVGDHFGYGSVNLDKSLLAAGDPPCTAVLANERGIEALEGGDDLTAEQHYREALAIYPQYVDAKNNLGDIYIRRRQPEKAVQELKAAAGLLTQPSPTVYKQLGVACYYALDMPCALDAYEHSLAVTTSTAEKMSLYNNLFQVYRYTGDFTHARQMLDAYTTALDTLASERTPDQEVLLDRDEGVLAFAEGRYSDAFNYLTAADAVQGARINWAEEVVYYLAKTTEKLGRNSEACQFWQRYAAIPPSSIFGEAERRVDARQSSETLGCSSR